MTASNDKPQDPKDEVAQLREQLDALSDPVQPAATAAKAAASSVADKASGVADQANDYAKQAYAAVNEQTERLADRTRQSPAVALGIACVVGYMLGRIVR